MSDTAPDPSIGPSHPRDPAPPVQVTDVTASYDVTPVLRGASLCLDGGQLGVIVGPSGCGKSTLLRAIAGLQQPDNGTIVVGAMTVDAPGTHIPSRKRRVGWVPQDPTLLPHLTVEENIVFGYEGAFGRTPRSARAKRSAAIAELIDATGLHGLEARYPDQLSGGQAQRVALARTLAAQPRLLLLDEPFAALDPPLRIALRDTVRGLLQEFGITGIMVTHDQEEALTTGDIVAIMRDGVIEQQGPPAEVYARPATAWAASFLGDAVFLTGPASEGIAQTVLGPVRLDDAATGNVRLVIRPEQVELTPCEASEPGACRVERVRFGGHDALVDLVAANGDTFLSRVHARDTPTVGATVTLSVAGPGVVVGD